MKEACTLKAQANLGEEIEEVEFDAGDELTVLKEWANHYLVKDDDGKIFNIEKSLVGS
jgi:hypothetical protein